STTCKTVRAPNAGNPPDRTYLSTECSAVWTPGHSIVLVYNSVGSIPLQALGGATGFKTPRWAVIRNPADNAALKAAPYPNQDLSLSSATGLTTNLSLDAVGSFSVVCYDDTNGNGQFDAGEPCC